MSTYVIGDIQGCYRELRSLLDKINLDPQEDELWLVGDLINRGPDNVAVLDCLMEIPRLIAVLGNHDLHFLAIAGEHMTQKRNDTLDDLLSSPGLPQYVEWLKRLPLIHHDPIKNCVLVHAGLPPQLSLESCLALAGEVESIISSERSVDFFRSMYGNEPDTWHDGLAGFDRLRIITNYLTRMRYCTAEGKLELTHKSTIQPAGYAPWFSFPRADNVTILFGHWAAIAGDTGVTFARALDTGCVWGRELTALRLEDNAIFLFQP